MDQEFVLVILFLMDIYLGTSPSSAGSCCETYGIVHFATWAQPVVRRVSLLDMEPQMRQMRSCPFALGTLCGIRQECCHEFYGCKDANELHSDAGPHCQLLFGKTWLVMVLSSLAFL